MKKRGRHLRWMRMSLCLMLVVIVIMSCTSVAFASTWSGTNWDMTEWKTEIFGFFKTLRLAMTAVAAVGFAASAFSMLHGDEKKVAIAKERIKWILIAVVAMYLLPAFISLGVEAASPYKWTPS